jgi:hypothetical protein
MAAEQRACFARFKGGLFHDQEKRWACPPPHFLTVLNDVTGEWTNYSLVDLNDVSKKESERIAVYESADWYEDESQDESPESEAPQPSVQAGTGASDQELQQGSPE